MICVKFKVKSREKTPKNIKQQAFEVAPVAQAKPRVVEAMVSPSPQTARVNRTTGGCEQFRNIVEKYAAKRAELKAAGDQEGLQKLPRNSSPTRLKNRDNFDGRPRGYMRRFGMSRITFRIKASKGEIPGVTKSSW